MRRVNSGRQGPTSLPWTGEHLENLEHLEHFEHLEHLENHEHFEPHLLGQYPEDGEVHHEQSEDHAEGSGQGLDHSSGAHSLLLAKKSKVVTKRQEQLEVRSSTLFSEELCCSEEVDNVKQVLM